MSAGVTGIAIMNETYYYEDEDDGLSSNSSAHNEKPEWQLWRWPEFYVSNQLWIIAGWIIIVIGSISHTLSISVLLGSKRMRLMSLTVYLVANSLAGLTSLHVGLLRQIILNHSDLDVRYMTTSFGCSLHVALTYMSLQLFSWLQATIAVERTIAVLRPLHYKRWCTWRRNLAVVACIVVFLGLLNIIIGRIYHKNEHGECHVADDQQWLFRFVWGHVDLVLFSLLPISVIVPCNVVTLVTIYRTRTKSRSTGRKHIQVTVMLLAQNCVCVLTTLPISALFLSPWPTEIASDAGARRELEWTVLSLLQYLGTTFAFAIYCTTAQRFRRAVFDLLAKCCNTTLPSLTWSSSRRQSQEQTPPARTASKSSSRL